MPIDGGIFGTTVERGSADNQPISDDRTTEIAKLVTTEESNGFGKFGDSVAISGNTAIIAAPMDSVGSNNQQGAAYIFVRNGSSWALQQRLVDVEGVADARFGNSVAIDGDTAVIGSTFSNFGSNLTQGAAFVFVRNGTTWTLQQKLVASDGSSNSLFGVSVSISGDSLAVGAKEDDVGANPNQGSAYVFSRNGSMWTEQQKLTAPDGAANDTFGGSVAILADRVIIGSQLSRIGVNNGQGAAYVFTRDGTVWNYEAKLVSNDGSFDDHFGGSVALSGNTAVLGSNFSDIGANINQGAAYVFQRSGTIWNQQSKLTASDGVPSDQFGTSVAIDGDNIVIGAVLNNPGGTVRVGAAYLFIRSGTGWNRRTKLVGSDFLTTLADRFGNSVAVGGNQILVGSPQNNFGLMVRRGAVYFFLTPSVAPDLQPSSDSGISNEDNITKNRELVFDIAEVTRGAVVNLLRDDLIVASSVAGSNNLTLTDTTTPENGRFNYTTQQIVGGEVISRSDRVFVVVDNTSPVIMVSQAAAQVDPTHIQPLNFSAIADEPIVGFEVSDVSLSGSTAGISTANIGVTGSGSNYDLTVSNITADGIVMTSVPANAANDLAGNPSAASFSTDNTITFDTTPPSVTINQSATQADPTRSLPVNFSVIFSEAVTNFDSSDVLLTDSTADVGSAIVTVSGGGTNFVVAVSGFPSNGAFVNVTIRAEAANDAAGNSSLASTSVDNVVVVDNTLPSVTIDQSPGQSDPTAVIPVTFSVVFSEPVTGFDSSDISFSGSTLGTAQTSIEINGSGMNYDVTVGGNIVSNGAYLQVRVLSGTVRDALGNSNLPSTSTDNRITIDNLAPTVTINQANGQADPTSTQPINFTVLFSEPVTDFAVGDISLTGSTSNVSFAEVFVTGSGRSYTVSIRNIGSTGELRASIPPGAATDITGNLSIASTSVDNIVSIIIKKAPIDFDGDGQTDISIFRPSVGEWWYLKSSNGQVSAAQFGASGDKPAPADVTGDQKTDIVFWRPSDGFWFILRSEDGTYFSFPFGILGDIPVIGDFDADGKADPGVFRPSNSTWYIKKSLGGTIIKTFGTAGDIPVVADYDGDGKSDVAVYRPLDGSWWQIRSSDDQFRAFRFGNSAEKPVPGDYTGDGKADIAVFRSSTGEWFIQRSEDDSYFSFPFGADGDVAVPGDYDGDGRFDPAVFRPISSTWFVNRTTTGILITNFGSTGDRPLPNVLVP